MAQTIEFNGVVYPAVEGEHERINDYYFYRLGAPIPVMLGNGGDGDPMSYDREYLPSQALAVSEQFELLFVALPSSGFLVAHTFDVMLTDLLDDERSVRDKSNVEVPVGRVRLLSLSPESSKLAACVGGTANLFSVESLYGLAIHCQDRIMNQNSNEQEPFLSPTIEGGSSIKDVSWLNEDSYILLSSCGNLYVGRMDGSLQFLMDNVDAVDCSPGVDYIAVARNDELRILSPGLIVESHIRLSLQPWTGNSDDSSVKVDSLKWDCLDHIILGCFQLTSDGMEESYLLLVISLRVNEILAVDNVQSFRDVFPRIVEDIMPAGSGPHLFFSCLPNHNFAIAANRKNVDQHVVLFDWRRCEQMTPVDIDRENWLPRIELQENGDDNSILGLCTDKISQWYFFKNYQYGQDSEIQGSNLICTLWCLSLEGKLSVFCVRRD